MKNGTIPIIGEVTEQKLIISFKKRDTGEGDISFDFQPPFAQAISPEQRAAVNVAEHIINLFKLQEAKNEEQKNGKLII